LTLDKRVLPPDPEQIAERARTLDHYVAEVAGPSAEHARARWDVATVAAPENVETMKASARALGRAHANVDRYERLRAWTAEALHDPETDRAVTLAYHAHAMGQGDEETRDRIVDLEAELHREFATHHPTYKKKPTTRAAIARVLATSSDDAERRAAWEAAHDIGPVVRDRILELVRLRNQLAKAAGFRDHYARAIVHQELSEDRLLATLTTLERATRDPFRSRKSILDGKLSDNLTSDTRKPQVWHYNDPSFRQVPTTGSVDLDNYFQGVDLVPRAISFFDGIAMNVRDVIERSDIEPRDGKAEHALCVHIDREDDLRILCTLVPSHLAMTTLMRELGRAAYARYLGRKLPWMLRQPAHGLISEAIASLTGRESSSGDFLVDTMSAPAFEVRPLRGEFRRRRAFELLLLVRWALVMVNFERALYADPDNPQLDDLWWELRTKYQLIDKPDDRQAPDWAAQIKLALAPVTHQNHLYGELVAAQLNHTIEKGSGVTSLVDNLYAGEFLIGMIFERGASMRWDQLVEEATGEPLSTAPFLSDIVAPER